MRLKNYGRKLHTFFERQMWPVNVNIVNRIIEYNYKRKKQ